MAVIAFLLLRDGREHSTSGGESASEFSQQLRARAVGGIDPTTEIDRTAVFAQPGARARRIAGRVTYEGQPVPNATVELHHAYLAGAMPASRKTDAAGRFDFGDRAPGYHQVLAYAPDLSGAYTWFDSRNPLVSPPIDALELELGPCEVRLSGTVSDVSGGPIAGARVRTRKSARAITGDEGHYELCVRRGAASVRASAEGYVDETVQSSLLGAAQVDIEMSPAASISGITVSEATNEPLAGVFVRARGRRVSSGTGYSDSDGRFRIDGLLPGRYSVMAQSGSAETVDRVMVVTRVGAPPEAVTCVLSESVPVQGRAELADGTPVVGMHISGSLLEGRGGSSADAVTQENGQFEFRSPPGKMRLHVTDYELVSDKSVEVAFPKAEVVVRVEPMATVRGRVQRAGKPVVGATVTARPKAKEDADPYRAGPRSRSARTNKKGEFEIVGLKPARYQVSAQNEKAFTRGQEIQVEKGATVSGIVLDLDLSAVIAGTVVDQSGSPVPGANLTFKLVDGEDWGYGVTDETGAFEAGAMSGGGEYGVTMALGRSSLIVLPPAKGTEHPTVYLADGNSHVEGMRYEVKFERLSIGGRVVREHGEGVPDIRVEARPKTADDRSREYSYYYYRSGIPRATTDVEGSFEFKDLPAGPYTVVAKGPAGTEVKAETEAGRDDVVLELPEVGALRGTVAGFTDTPTVRACAERRGCFEARVNGQEWTIEDLPPGTYGVTGVLGNEVASESAEVVGGKQTTVALESLGSATVQGRVIEFPTGEAVDGAGCRWRGRRYFYASGDKGVTSDASGRFELTVPAGVGVSVTCGAAPTGRGSRVPVLVEAGASAQVEVIIVRVDHSAYRNEWGATLAREGPATLATVTPGGPAAVASLAVGDVVVGVDGDDVRRLDWSQVDALIRARKAGQSAAITVTRGNETIEATVTVTKRKIGPSGY